MDQTNTLREELMLWRAMLERQADDAPSHIAARLAEARVQAERMLFLLDQDPPRRPH